MTNDTSPSKPNEKAAYVKLGQTQAIINQRLLKVLPELKGQPGYESFSTVFRTGKPYMEIKFLYRLRARACWKKGILISPIHPSSKMELPLG